MSVYAKEYIHIQFFMILGRKFWRERAPKYNLFFFYSLPFLSQILESVKCWLEFSGKDFSITDWEFVLLSGSGSCPTGPCLKG